MGIKTGWVLAGQGSDGVTGSLVCGVRNDLGNRDEGEKVGRERRRIRGPGPETKWKNRGPAPGVGGVGYVRGPEPTYV